MLPALGFLGLGPVVLRQRLGRDHARRRAPRPRRRRVARLPRPDRRLRALPRSQVRSDPAARLLRAGRRVPQHRVPRVSARAEVGRRRLQGGARRRSEEQAGPARRLHRHRERSSWPRRSRSRPSKYMQAAWKVTGEPKNDAETRRRRARSSITSCSSAGSRFLAKPPKFYPYLKKWQEMIKDGRHGGRSEDARRRVPGRSLIDVMLETREIKDENDIIRAKALPGTKKKERGQPAERVRHQRRLLPRLRPRAEEPAGGADVALYADVFRARLVDSADPADAKEDDKPGAVRRSAAGGSNASSAPIAARYIDALRDDIKALKKALPPKYAYVHGVEDVEKPARSKVALRGNPFKLGDEVPRGISRRCWPTASRRRSRRAAAALELADAIVEQPIAMRVIVNRIWKWHFGTGLVDTPSNFGKQRRAAVATPSCSSTWRSWFVDQRLLDQEAAPRDHAERRLSARAPTTRAANFAKDSGNRLYWRANRAPHDGGADPRLGAVRRRARSTTKMGGPSEELTPLGDAPHDLRQGAAATSSTSSCSSSTSRAPTISAEKRFSTNVPLQRLFLMNSDFMQQQAEQLARARRSASPTTRADPEGVPHRSSAATPTRRGAAGRPRVSAAEPMQRYEERKAEEAEDRAKDEKNAKPASRRRDRTTSRRDAGRRHDGGRDAGRPARRGRARRSCCR